MLGASRARVHATVILALFGDAAVPGRRLGRGARRGVQTGLGFVIVYAQQFAYLDCMFRVSLVFVLCTSASYMIVQRLFARWLVWASPEARS